MQKVDARPLTPRQKDFIAAVESLTTARGFPPSLHEIAEQLGISPTRVTNIGRECVDRGAVQHTPRVPRSWRVLVAPTRQRSR